ncbi:MAG: 50S ribosomal protein L23, partial [Clostridiales Family XIII bacterium]|nr:50S ribosomal protein L23 [Clostridiales Family XIII bacterium]
MDNPYDIIREPVISEKSMKDAGNKRYTFKVAPKAKKEEIKDAIEKIFEVSVKKVNTMNY